MRVLNAEAQVEYRSQIADEREAAVCNRHAKQRDVQRNELSENQLSTVVRSGARCLRRAEDLYAVHVRVKTHRIPMS